MSAATSIVIERATEGDVAAISSLLKRSFEDEKIFGGRITNEDTDISGLKDLITKQHCVFDVAIDTQFEGRVLIGVAWWYFHMPKGWSGDKKGLFEALFAPTSNEPKDSSECGFGADLTSSFGGLTGVNMQALGQWRSREFDEPLLVIHKVCIDEDRRSQRLAESLLKHTFSWAVRHDVKVMLTVDKEVVDRVMLRLREVLSDVVVGRYRALPGDCGKPRYYVFFSQYGVNEPYPEVVKEAARTCWKTA
ncbi:hypothetical protein SLS62_006261 [Diatrype stigma]|uniref:Uncharacterized protein n=1 Tax=Diatrype stigma TaxID=117547 RepID=A0AAN9YS23_9PEZI